MIPQAADIPGRRWGGGRQQEIYHFLSGNLSPLGGDFSLPRTSTSPLPALPAISSAGLVFLRLKMEQRDQLL